MKKSRFTYLLFEREQGISLGIYRITFGLMMCFSLCRFMYNSWIEACYIEPDFHFTYQYFHWIQPFDNEIIMYLLYLIAIVCTLLITIGMYFRIGIVLFFLLFTYFELIEKAWYLNHYYFVSLIAFLLIFIPADSRFSFQKNKPLTIPKIYSTILKFQISCVYFFAGIAKLNSDWLVDALPLKIWLKAKGDLPIIGDLLIQDWVAYAFSYSGMLYDVFIPFLLWNKRTRPLALVAVVVFHTMTGILFPIGLFPLIMIVGSLIFITDEEWKSIFKWFSIDFKPIFSSRNKPKIPKWLLVLFSFYFLIQIILPLRHHFYNENFLWTERHYRFGWNVMLAEKGGSAIFKVKDNNSDKIWTIYPSEYLTQIQEKQMSYQADMIWLFAQYLEAKFQQKGYEYISIFVENKVTFNGRSSQTYLPNNLDLLTISEDNIYDFVVELE